MGLSGASTMQTNPLPLLLGLPVLWFGCCGGPIRLPVAALNKLGIAYHKGNDLTPPSQPFLPLTLGPPSDFSNGSFPIFHILTFFVLDLHGMQQDGQ